MTANLSLWAVGDLQGCGAQLEELLARLPNETRLIFVGDIVNRGPQSLHCLRTVKALCDAGRAIALLGNHDLHLLAVAAGIRPQHDDDTLGDVLAAPDRDALLDWLRARPLAHAQDGALFVHAGVLPQWTAAQTLALAGEVQSRLQAPDHRGFLASMYGNRPARWHASLAGAERLRCIINALTRLRFVDGNGTMDFHVKDGLVAAPAGFVPWFDHPQRATRDVTVIFGHWSTLGFFDSAGAVCLDTGCVWGGALTAFSWPDRQRIQVRCPQAQDPAA
jgi:bis(5'-nucleosyl)-tetraphosphatase (symmetrical)